MKDSARTESQPSILKYTNSSSRCLVLRRGEATGPDRIHCDIFHTPDESSLRVKTLDSASLALRYPTSVVRVWGSDRASCDLVRDTLLEECDAVGLEDDALAIVPTPGDPAVFDAGLHWSRRMLAKLEGAADGPRILLSPAEVLLRGTEVLGIHDDITDNLSRRPPVLDANHAYLTTWAAQSLETSWDLTPSGTYRGASGQQVPLVQATSQTAAVTPWRNPGMLGRQIMSTRRPELEKNLEEHLDDRVIRVTGPVGCGKTRLVWETLHRKQRTFLWLQAHPARRRGLSLARQIAEHVLEASTIREGNLSDPASTSDDSPRRAIDKVLALLATHESASQDLYLVCDDCEQILQEDLELLLELGNAKIPNRRLHLILIGRGASSRTGFEGTFSLRVPEFADTELADLTERLFNGLSLPDVLSDHLLKATHGHPFALEEGLLSLVRSKVMRTLYGNFFFAGTEPTNYQPSARLISHIQAEAGRLGHSTRLMLLALADTPVPPDVLSVAAGHVEKSRDDTWATPAVEAGMLRRVPSPWGIGVEFSCPAYARALALSAPEETVLEMRGRLGRALQPVSQNGKQQWFTYRLLEGSTDASAALLKTARSSYAGQLDPETLFEALGKELTHHRANEGDEETELLLIWRMLPTARRLGKLQHCVPELERALEMVDDDSEKQLALASLIASAHEEAGQHRQAETALLSGLKNTSASDQPKRRARLALQLGAIYERTGRLSEASRLLEDLYPALESQDHDELAASCHFTLGEIALRRNRLEEAITHHRAAYETRNRLGEQRAITTSLTALGRVAHVAGNYPQALEYFDEALNNVSDMASEECARVLLGTAAVLRRLGDYQQAATLNRQALAIHERREDASAEAAARLALAETLFDLEQFDKALVEARNVHFKMDLLSMPAELADAEQLIGRIEHSHRRHEAAVSHLERALEKHTDQGNARGTALDHAWLIDIALGAEDGSALRRHTSGLQKLLPELLHSSIFESLSYRMFRGLSWLRLHDTRVEDPRPHLEHGYREVLRKAFPLDPDRRHQFLFEVQDNREILDAATHEGLATPGG